MTKKTTKLINVPVEEELIERLREEGQKEERNLSAQVRYILKQWADNLRKEER